MRRVVFTTWPLLSATKKYVLPAHYGNNFIYQFVCYWDSRYVGRTSQNLQERIKQHVPRPIRNHHSLKMALIFPVLARDLKLLPSFLLLDNIFWKIFHAPANTVTPNSPFLPEDVLLFTCPLLNLILSNLFNLIYVDTMNFFTV